MGRRGCCVGEIRDIFGCGINGINIGYRVEIRTFYFRYKLKLAEDMITQTYSLFINTHQSVFTETSLVKSFRIHSFQVVFYGQIWTNASEPVTAIPVYFIVFYAHQKSFLQFKLDMLHWTH